MEEFIQKELSIISYNPFRFRNQNIISLKRQKDPTVKGILLTDKHGLPIHSNSCSC